MMKLILNSKTGKYVFVNLRYYSNTVVKKGKSKYSTTLNLPKTALPLRLEKKALLIRDEKILENKDVYKWQQENLQDPVFILHDGPPYANGDLHMGHAINKILKDTILRYKILQKQKVHYVPGWDCHGLPIELKALSKVKIKKELQPLEIRQRAKQFAEDTVVLQKQEFQSWGILGDWNNIYTTDDVHYLKKQLNVFYSLYEKQLIFRDLKPVYWSPSSRTALAEAELEYNENHISTAIILKLEVKDFKVTKDYNNERIYALIWTTTPWTLPCNQAICIKNDLSYSLVRSKVSNVLYIIASNLIQNISKTLKDGFNVLINFKGNDLSGSSYFHPLDKNRLLPFLLSDHVSDDKGTGLVHTAPAHGPDDFLVALKYKLPVVNFINDDGSYNEKAGFDLNGRLALKEGQNIVLNKLKEDILHCQDYIHSYPYDWRTKEPVIVKASQQWFIDTNKIKDRAVELLDNVTVYPDISSEIYKKNLVNQLKKRAYWCISRQRVWGVPIPVFFDKSTEKVLITKSIIDRMCDLIEKTNGLDFWWQQPVKDLLTPSIFSELQVSEENVTKSQDILDIWFDSGISWCAVLNDKTADLYLEGVDQFTGWFQSSLITSTALKNRSPYKSIYVHGFAVDEKKQKMSKSLGNVIYPGDIVKGLKGKKPYGIDVLRWWVVCHASRESKVDINDNTLQACADEVQKIRSILRFAVSNLNDFNNNEIVPEKSFSMVDKYMLHMLKDYINSIQNHYENFNFSKINLETLNFVSNQVSAMYFSSIKDRLYCEKLDDPVRRAAQFVLREILNILTRAVAPIVPHLAEEVYEHSALKDFNSFFKTSLILEENWTNNCLKDFVEKILVNVKREIHKEAGSNVAEYKVVLTLEEDFFRLLQHLQPNMKLVKRELCDFFQISEIEIEEKRNFGGNYKVKVEKSGLFQCERCRQYNSTKEFELCERCFTLVENNSLFSVSL